MRPTDGWNARAAITLFKYWSTLKAGVFRYIRWRIAISSFRWAKKDKRSMAMLEDWTIYSWYCPNCKTQVAGLKNKKNQIRVICTKCGVEMVRTVVSRRHDVIDMFAPSGMEHSELELREHWYDDVRGFCKRAQRGAVQPWPKEDRGLHDQICFFRGQMISGAAGKM